MSYWFESYIPWFRRRVRGFRKPQATRSSLIDCAQRHGLGANPMASANRRPLSLSTAAAAEPPCQDDQNSPRATPKASLARSVLMPLQGGIEAFDQSLSVERFGQEANCSDLQRSGADGLFGERRDENERQEAALSGQEALQLETAHGWHLDIRNHARRVIQARRMQELLGRCKCMDGVSERPYEVVGRDANGCIIVNYRDHGNVRQMLGPLQGNGAYRHVPLRQCAPKQHWKIILRFAPATASLDGFRGFRPFSPNRPTTWRPFSS